MEHDVTQHLSIIVHNNLQEGDITIKNTVIIRYFKVFCRPRTENELMFFGKSGQLYKDNEKFELLSPEEVDKTVVPRGGNRTISFCGSATFRLGVEGKIDLHCDDHGRIASLYWNGPWTRIGNQFDVTNLNSEEYRIIVPAINGSGTLGDVSVIVARIGHCFQRPNNRNERCASSAFGTLATFCFN